ncbi:hypothetical protein 15D039_00226 [Fowlpox virus]|nr:ALPV-299 [Albatrosspox virus]URH24945.1 hypothetical protein 10D392_00225 [Fowlpox virus]URH25729.1 hypothetical protein 15D039_00226 [Fowlpox virus]URH25989.1 hypothetical protein 18Q061_00229 [Fowlpox virus]URH26253.1 hypothetical protein 18R056_00230 [Fowlpox virus]
MLSISCKAMVRGDWLNISLVVMSAPLSIILLIISKLPNLTA